MKGMLPFHINVSTRILAKIVLLFLKFNFKFNIFGFDFPPFGKLKI